MNITTVYQQHQHELIHFTTRITSCRATAEDIIQESFIILYHKEKEQVIENPRAFLFCVARNLALDYLKHQKVVDNYAQTVSDEHPITSSMEQELASEQQREHLRHIINELPPRCRDVFILNKLKELSYNEVAKHTGISESGVEKHIMKGLQHCRNRLNA